MKNINNSHCVQDPSGYIALKEHCLELNIVYLVSDWHKKSLTGVICSDSILILPTCVLNFLVIFVVRKHRQLQTTANFLLANLAASDFCIGLIFQPCKIASTVLILNCKSVCGLFVTIFHLGYYLATVSFLMLTLVSIDRYIAITHPFLYHRVTTSNNISIIAMFVTWTLPLLVSIVSIASGQMRLPSLMFSILAPLSIVVCIVAQVCTIKAVRNVRKRDATLSISADNNNTRHSLRKNYVREKATRVAGVILLATIGCYTPHAVLTLIRTLRKDILAFQGIYEWSKTLVIINSTLNPIIYCWILKEMRTRILQTILWPKPSRRINQSGVTMSRFGKIEMKTIPETKN